MKIRIVICMLLLLSNISISFACDCKPKRTVSAEFESSDVVFVGKVLNRKEVKIGDTSKNYTTVASYDLQVQLMYKGKVTTDTITIFTGMGGADCGVRFEIGKKYVVYGDKEDYYYDKFKYAKKENIFYTNNCKRTTIHTEAEIQEIEQYLMSMNRQYKPKPE